MNHLAVLRLLLSQERLTDRVLVSQGLRQVVLGVHPFELTASRAVTDQELAGVFSLHNFAGQCGATVCD